MPSKSRRGVLCCRINRPGETTLTPLIHCLKMAAVGKEIYLFRNPSVFVEFPASSLDDCDCGFGEQEGRYGG